MTDTNSPSINDLARGYAYEVYLGSDAHKADLAGSVDEAALLKAGFTRGYSSRDDHFDNYDRAYNELVDVVSELQGYVLTYAQMADRIKERLDQEDSMSLVPFNIMTDLDQIILDAMVELTEEPAEV
jgi:hypothetical protein